MVELSSAGRDALLAVIARQKREILALQQQVSEQGVEMLSLQGVVAEPRPPWRNLARIALYTAAGFCFMPVLPVALLMAASQVVGGLISGVVTVQLVVWPAVALAAAGCSWGLLAAADRIGR